jgi:hypothetical protein
MYTDEVHQAVGQLWELSDNLCWKRLVPMIRAAMRLKGTS